MNTKKRLLIVDDHPSFRDSLKQIIDRLPDYQIVGEAEDARQGEHAAEQNRPELAVIDLSLPDKSGIQLTRILKTRQPDISVVIVSMHAKIDYIIDALKAGAHGYVVKESVGRHLKAALDAAANQVFYLDPALSGEIVGKLLELTSRDNIANASYGELTSREQEILRLLAMGTGVKEIAEQLCISPKTVTNHRTNIMGKLDLHSTVELVRYAGKIGLLDDLS